jgi:hypothetical protein
MTTTTTTVLSETIRLLTMDNNGGGSGGGDGDSAAAASAGIDCMFQNLLAANATPCMCTIFNVMATRADDKNDAHTPLTTTTTSSVQLTASTTILLERLYTLRVAIIDPVRHAHALQSMDIAINGAVQFLAQFQWRHVSHTTTSTNPDCCIKSIPLCMLVHFADIAACVSDLLLFTRNDAEFALRMLHMCHVSIAAEPMQHRGGGHWFMAMGIMHCAMARCCVCTT